MTIGFFFASLTVGIGSAVALFLRSRLSPGRLALAAFLTSWVLLQGLAFSPVL